MKLLEKLKEHSDILIITVIGLVLRAKEIIKDDLWYDEAFTGILMRVDNQQFWEIAQRDPHPPLYYLMLKGWTLLFGVNDLSLRSLSLVFGILTIVAVYLLVKKLFNKEAAAITALLTAINPFLISYSVEARSYSFYAFMVVLTALCVVYKKYVMVLVGSIVLVLTHYMAAVYLPILGLWLLWQSLGVKKELTKSILSLIPAAVIAVFIYYPVITSKTNNNLNIDWVEPASVSSVSKSITAYAYGVKSRLSGADDLNYVDFVLDVNLLGLIVFVSYLIGIAGIIIKFRKDKEKFGNYLFSLSMVFLPMIFLIAYTIAADNNIYVQRYLIPSSVFFSVTLGVAVSYLLNFEVMGILLVFYVFTLTRIVSPGYYEGMKDLAAEFRSSQSEVVFTSPIDFVVAKYYFNSDNIKLYVPKDPENTFGSWPFIRNAVPENLNSAIIISPDEDRLTEEYRRPIENLEYGNYKVWIRSELVN